MTKHPNDYLLVDRCNGTQFSQNCNYANCDNCNSSVCQICDDTVTFAPQEGGSLDSRLQWIDSNGSNPWLGTTASGGIIIQPPASQQYQLNGGNPITTSDPGAATIPLEGANLPGQTVSWSATIDYTDSGGHKAKTVPISINPTLAYTPVNQLFPSGEGGQVTLNATVGSYTDGVTVYIPGTDIDTNNLDTYLGGLSANENLACTGAGAPWPCCNGSGTGTCTQATPDLFELIANEETDFFYEQFVLLNEIGDPNLPPMNYLCSGPSRMA